MNKRKAFGQHFLKDERVCEDIVAKTMELAKIHHCQGLLEVGPGKGAITEKLASALDGKVETPIKDWLIVEKDRKLADHWIESAKSNLTPTRVISDDFLKVPDSEWAKVSPLAVVSNLPYSVGTAILQKLALRPDKVPFMVLMFQAEVAERLRSVPDGDHWGSLSIWVQNQWDVSLFLKVPPGAFRPPPKVDSEVVVLKARATPLIPITAKDPELFEKLLKVSFAHRRKMLRSGLPSSGPWKKALGESKLDPTLRAEALSFEDWGVFFEALLKVSAV